MTHAFAWRAGALILLIGSVASESRAQRLEALPYVTGLRALVAVVPSS